MNNFLKLAGAVDVSALALALHLQPELWNANAGRKNYERSPHRDTSDIWLRYNDPAALGESYVDWTKRHDSVWLPAAAKLPQLRPIVFDMMARCEAVRLGGMLITKIPPGAKVYPHADTGWHPTYYNAKIYVPLQANEGCVNIVESERITMRVGDAWYFDNLKPHAVENNGDTDRVTLIICLRVDHSLAIRDRSIEGIKHHFSAGTYLKRSILKGGAGAITHAHKYDHVSILAQGSVLVTVDGKITRHTAPAEIDMAAGKHHSIAALEDSVWYCVHATTETDAEKIDETLIEDSRCRLPS